MVTAASQPGADPLLSAPVAIGLLVTLLLVANVSRSTVIPDAWHLVFNVATGLAVLILALAAGLTAANLGAAADRVAAGCRLGGLAFLAVTVVLVSAGLIGALTDREAEVSLGDMLLRTLVLIPLGTVMVEELVFRGVLHGLLVQVTSARGAMLVGAVLFGLWHVFPAWRGGAVETDVAGVGRVVTVAGTFAATTVAGALFVWLRVRSGSLVAPALAHLATNSVTFALAWALR